MRDRPPFPFAVLRIWLTSILPLWAMCALLIFLVQIAICGIVHDNESVKMFLSLIDMFPAVVKATLGGRSLRVGNTPALIAIGYQHPSVLFLYMFFAVSVPAILLTNEVQKGTMELILSRYVTKTQIYLSVCILTIVGMWGLISVMLLGTVVGTSIYDFGEPIPLDLFVRLAVNGGLLASAVAAIALLCTSYFRRLYTAVGVPVVLLVTNYLASLISELWPRMEFLQPATLFYYVGSRTISYEWPLGNMAVLASILVIAAVAGGIVWQRRDLLV